jgi:hypothetical protein
MVYSTLLFSLVSYKYRKKAKYYPQDKIIVKEAKTII